MIARIEVAGGVYIDARNVPVALIALFEGWPAGLLAAAIAAGYRAWLGGGGALAGIVALFATAVVGGLASAWARRGGGVRARHALALSLAVFLVSFGAFALVGERALELFGRVWVYLLVAYVVGIGFFARLLHDSVEEARLAAEQQRFRAVIDEASDAIRIVDPDTLRILDANRRDCEISGYTRDEMIGRDVREFWPEEPELRIARETALAEVRAHGFARNFGVPYRRRSGEITRVDSTRRIVDHHGRRYEIVIYRESTGREAAEAAQREASDLRAITLVASAAAHEINNPLTVVVGSLELLARRVPRDAEERRWIDKAGLAAQRIRDIVARMTRITRVEKIASRSGLPAMLDIKKSSDAS